MLANSLGHFFKWFGTILHKPENTHLLQYHRTTDVLFNWFGFGKTSKSVEYNTTAESKPV